MFKEMQNFWNHKAIIPGAITPGEREADLVAQELLEGIPGDALEKAHLLEIGCGEGRLMMEIAPKVEKYYGIDISRVALDRAITKSVQYGLENVDLRIADEGMCGFMEEDFDIIVSWAVFMHLPKKQFLNYLRMAKIWLRPLGYFHFQLSCHASFTAQDFTHRFDIVDDKDFWKGRWYPEWLAGHYIIKNGFSISLIGSGK